MSKWKPIDTAPRDGTQIRVRIPGYGSGNIVTWRRGFENAAGTDCGCWVVADNLEPPPCWTDGVCWERNEDGHPSVQPTHWRPLP